MAIIMSEVTAGVPSFPCGPCLRCHDAWGDALDEATSSLNICAACYTVTWPSGPTYDISITVTGLNGSFPGAAWDGTRWTEVVGAVTVSYFDSIDGTCTGFIKTATFDVLMIIRCAGANLLTAAIVAFNITHPTGLAVVNFVFFTNDGTGTLGDAMANTHVLGDCGSESSPTVIMGYGGTVTVTLP